MAATDGSQGLLSFLPAHLWFALIGGGVGLAISLAILCCLRSQKRRKLLFLLFTHPNPAMGPLYMPDERRDEYARTLGLKRPPPQLWSLLCCLGGGRKDRHPSTIQQAIRQQPNKHPSQQHPVRTSHAMLVKQPSEIVDAAALAVTVAAAAVCSAHSTAAGTAGTAERQQRTGRRSRLLAHSNPSIRWFYEPPTEPRMGSGRMPAENYYEQQSASPYPSPKAAHATAPVRAASYHGAAACLPPSLGDPDAAHALSLPRHVLEERELGGSNVLEGGTRAEEMMTEGSGLAELEAAVAACAGEAEGESEASIPHVPPTPPGPPPSSRRRRSREEPHADSESLASEDSVSAELTHGGEEALWNPNPVLPPGFLPDHPLMLGPSTELETLAEIPSPPSSCGRASGRSTATSFAPPFSPTVMSPTHEGSWAASPLNSPRERAAHGGGRGRHGGEGRLTREEREALAGLQLHLNRAASGFVQQELERVAERQQESGRFIRVNSQGSLARSDHENTFPGDGATSPRSESALSEGNRSVFSDGSYPGRSMTGTESSIGYTVRTRGERSISPHSASARSVRSEGERSSGTGTTATTCREALASLRLLAQQLPPGFAQNVSDPAVVAANLRAIGARAGIGSPTSTPSPIGGAPMGLNMGACGSGSAGASGGGASGGCSVSSRSSGRHGAISPGGLVQSFCSSLSGSGGGSVGGSGSGGHGSGGGAGAPASRLPPLDVSIANTCVGCFDIPQSPVSEVPSSSDPEMVARFEAREAERRDRAAQMAEAAAAATASSRPAPEVRSRPPRGAAAQAAAAQSLELDAAQIISNFPAFVRSRLGFGSGREPDPEDRDGESPDLHI